MRIKFEKTISTKEELRDYLGHPSELAEKKVIRELDEHCRTFISLSPFVVVSTTDKSGNADVSPRGDQPGFVQILNDHQLIIPERKGNKRADTMMNILENPSVGLLFFIPGLGEMLRVNGKAVIVRDGALLEKMSVRSISPLAGIVVEVEECFIQCAKAAIRSGIWQPHSWANLRSMPSAAQILADHAKLCNKTVSEIDEGLKDGYVNRLY
ncbi:MAG: pyridoxamine 5'-phosphate oxidase family protein [Bacillota bacterium]|nr:pyridoxamine 5'-phosphate oxidase family protein [Bacillota bacterium]